MGEVKFRRIEVYKQALDVQMSSLPGTEGMDDSMNTAFKDYTIGFPEMFFVAKPPLKLRYDYGEPSRAPTEEDPHTMLPGDALVDEDGQPIRWLWDTSLYDQILDLKKRKKNG